MRGRALGLWAMALFVAWIGPVLVAQHLGSTPGLRFWRHRSVVQRQLQRRATWMAWSSLAAVLVVGLIARRGRPERPPRDDRDDLRLALLALGAVIGGLVLWAYWAQLAVRRWLLALGAARHHLSHGLHDIAGGHPAVWWA